MFVGERKKVEVGKRIEIDGEVMKAEAIEDEGEGLSLQMKIKVRKGEGVLRSPVPDLMTS